MALPSSTFSFSSLQLIRSIKSESPTTKTHFPSTVIYKNKKSSVHYCTVRNLCRLAPKNSVNYGKGMVSNASAAKGRKHSNFGRIKFLSNVVKRKNIDIVFWGRKWSAWDVTSIMLFVSLHFLCLFAPFTFNWGAFWVAFGLYIITGMLGITLCYHRLLSHKSFKLPKWLEYFFAYCGVLALQRDPIFWVSTHRCHHQYCDSENDPHSPIKGFWFSHLTWIFDNSSRIKKCMNSSSVQDLEEQPFYKFLESTYLIHPLVFGAILYAIGGFPYLVWGCGVRIAWVYHATWLVNSVCHIWGTQTWNTGDRSRNNWWVALLTFGEGWHNNHHAFEYSARHGLEWWQMDVTWYLIKFFKIIGLATDVKLPTLAQKQRMAFKNNRHGEGCVTSS